MRVVVWGTGRMANEYMARKCYHYNDDVIAFVDNNRELWGKKFRNIRIISPDNLERMKFDKLIICTVHSDEIKGQIKNGINVSPEKVITYSDLENSIKNEIIKMYEDHMDKSVQKVLDYYSSTESLNIFGYYEGDTTKALVKYEPDGMPYILFEGKKMFYPKTYKFAEIDNSRYVMNLLYEQGNHSPHKYLKTDDMIRKDMVIVDAGVCEGNFALRHVEYARKLYLIESDPTWAEALRRTFLPYKEKVIICDKYLSEEDAEHTITLDSLVDEKIDFLKMDIEGYEVAALKGAKRTLQESNAHCAICSYHRHGDEGKIKALLEAYGYLTDTSEGYMFFVYDTYLELRKGIVYGEKE